MHSRVRLLFHLQSFDSTDIQVVQCEIGDEAALCIQPEATQEQYSAIRAHVGQITADFDTIAMNLLIEMDSEQQGPQARHMHLRKYVYYVYALLRSRYAGTAWAVTKARAVINSQDLRDAIIIIGNEDFVQHCDVNASHFLQWIGAGREAGDGVVVLNWRHFNHPIIEIDELRELVGQVFGRADEDIEDVDASPADGSDAGGEFDSSHDSHHDDGALGGARGSLSSVCSEDDDDRGASGDDGRVGDDQSSSFADKADASHDTSVVARVVEPSDGSAEQYAAIRAQYCASRGPLEPATIASNLLIEMDSEQHEQLLTVHFDPFQFQPHPCQAKFMHLRKYVYFVFALLFSRDAGPARSVINSQELRDATIIIGNGNSMQHSDVSASHFLQWIGAGLVDGQSAPLDEGQKVVVLNWQHFGEQIGVDELRVRVRQVFYDIEDGGAALAIVSGTIL